MTEMILHGPAIRLHYLAKNICDIWTKEKSVLESLIDVLLKKGLDTSKSLNK